MQMLGLPWSKYLITKTSKWKIKRSPKGIMLSDNFNQGIRPQFACQGDGLFTAIVRKGQVMSKLYRYTDSPNLIPTISSHDCF